MSNENEQSVEEIMSQVQSIDPNDPDKMEKLNAIALQVAQAQGKATGSTNSQSDVTVDPMDELGCEGCQ